MVTEIEFTVKGSTNRTDVDNGGHNIQAIMDSIVHYQDIKKITESIRLTLKNKDKAIGIKRANQIKKDNLPLFFPCVVLSDSSKFGDNEYVMSTGLVQFDIDDISIEDSIKIREELINKIPYLYYAFISPKGGLKFGLLTDFKETNKTVIKDKFKLLYSIVRKHIVKNVDSINDLDDQSNQIERACYLSHDKDAYWNDGCEVLEVNTEINEVYIENQKENEKIEQDQIQYNKNNLGYTTSISEVQRALSYIPKDSRYHYREKINYSVFDELGSEGISLLYNHWMKTDRNKLKKQLEVQCKSHLQKRGNTISIGTLFKEAKENGFNFNPYGMNNTGSYENDEPTYNEPKISVVDSKDRLKKIVSDFFKEKKNVCALVEAGLGKTFEVLKYITEEFDTNKKIRVAYIVPDHTLGDDVISDSKEYSDWSMSAITPFKSIKGIGKLCQMIPASDKDEDWFYSDEVCNKCGIFHTDICQYHEQFKDNFAALRVYTKEYLFQPSKLDYNWKPDYIIIDEDIVNNITYEKTVKNEPLINKILKECIGKNFEDVLISFEGAIRKEKNNITSNFVTDQKNTSLGVMNHNKELFKSGEYKRHLIVMLNWINYYKYKSNPILQQLKDIPSDKIEIMTNKKNQIYMSIRGIKEIHHKWDNIPILYLDASGEQGVIEKATGINFDDYHSIRTEYNKNVEISTISNASISRKWLSDKDNKQMFIQFMRLIDNGTTALTTYKKLGEEKFKDNLIKQNVIAEENLLWFGKLRGSDKFSEKNGNFNQQIQMGRQQLSGNDIARKHQLFFNLDKPVEPETKLVNRTFKMKDGDHITIDNWGYCNSGLAMISEHFDKGESYQGGNRLRLIHGNKRKRLLLLSNNVLDFEYSRVFNSRAIFLKSNSPRVKFIEVINKYKVVDAKNNKFLIDKTGCSEGQIKQTKIRRYEFDDKKWVEHNPFFDVIEVQVKRIGRPDIKPKDMTFFVVWDLEKPEFIEILKNIFNLNMIDILSSSNQSQLNYWSSL